jgi:DNA mismatch endonuclease (patch repair protein)
VDTVPKSKRSEIMARVRSEDTKPEMIVRRLVFGLGFRYRLHARDLPGRPDLIFKSRRQVIFVHGCFWHGHDCSRGARPSSNQAFWEPKLARNRVRDEQTVTKLLESGWKVLTIWECEIRNFEQLKCKVVDFLSLANNG